MTTYRERRAAKAEKLREWAEKRRVKAEAASARASAIADMIPMGQPVLAGHHSQRRHQRDLERIRSGMLRGLENQQKAASFESRAANIDAAAAAAIYRDDPDALEALRRRIGELEAERDRIKAYNASARKGSPDETLLDERQRSGLASVRRHAPEQLGKGGALPGYQLSNLAGSISKNRQRLEQLAARAAAAPAAAEEAAEETVRDEYTDEQREALNEAPTGHAGNLPGALWPAIRANVGGIRITNRTTGRRDYDRDMIPGGLARVQDGRGWAYPDHLGAHLIPVFGEQAEQWGADEALERIRREYEAYKELPTKVRLRLHGRTMTDHDRAAARQRRHLLKLDAAIDRERQRHRLRHAAHRRAIAFFTDDEGIVHPITVAD